MRHPPKLLVTIEAGATRYFLRDHLSVRAVTDTTGTKIGDQGHYPYGEAWYTTGTTTKYLFTTYERDSESGNDYAISRSYVNRLARFSSPDPVRGRLTNPQRLNRYTYVMDDPVNRLDPQGRDCDDWEFNHWGGAWEWGNGDRILFGCDSGGGGGGGGGDGDGGGGESAWERCRREVFVPCMDIAESRNKQCNLLAGGACALAIGLCASVCDLFPPGCANCVTRALAFCASLYFRCSEALDRDTRTCYDKLNQCVQRAGP